MIEDKIKEYLLSLPVNTEEIEQLTHDISEICEKEMKECMLVNFNVEKGELTINHITELEKENAELKQMVKCINDSNITETYLKVKAENAELKQQIDRLHKNEIIYEKRLKDIK
jgi:predicted transglutaminase-like cysteine proteinase